MKPPIAYYGGKSGMARTIVGLLPSHRVYIEPCFGSGAVFFAKRPVVHEIVNDLDGAVVAFFRCLRDRLDDLERVCALSPYARAEFVAADLDDLTIDDLELARRFWVRVNQSFAKTAGRRTGWSVTTARTQSTSASTQARLGRFAACAERLMNASIEQCDAADLITRLATPDTAIYLDLPYLGTARSGFNATAGAAGDYRCDMPSAEEHRRIAQAVTATPAAVVLSGYPSALYDELYDGWHALDIAVTVHSSNARTGGRGGRVERIWSNRPLEQGRLFAENVAVGDTSTMARTEHTSPDRSLGQCEVER